MCIAIPGKLIEKTGPLGKVDIRGNIIAVDLGVVKAEVGNFVLVHAGCAISVMAQDEAEELDELLNTLEELCNE